MENHEKHLEDLHEIRNLMARSARFISLSGLSGISAGIFALAGAFITWKHFGEDVSLVQFKHYRGSADFSFLVFVAGAVFLLSLVAGIFFTTRNAKLKGQKIWDRTSQSLLLNLAIPLAAGGLFCTILLNHAPELIAPSTLIFYGMSLLNASKYTLPDIRTLGVCEITLGLLACTQTGYGLLFWALGFGVLHIVYGTVMYFRYEK